MSVHRQRLVDVRWQADASRCRKADVGEKTGADRHQAIADIAKCVIRHSVVLSVSEVVQTLHLSTDQDPTDVVGDLSVCLDGMQVDPEMFATAQLRQGSKFSSPRAKRKIKRPQFVLHNKISTSTTFSHFKAVRI